MMKFTIPRDKWARGGEDAEGKSQPSLLLCRDGKQCCVGHYLNACGVERDLLDQRACADDLLKKQLPLEARWLILNVGDDDSFPVRSEDAQFLYWANDKWLKGGGQGLDEKFSDRGLGPIVDDASREAAITKLFAEHDVEVEFV